MAQAPTTTKRFFVADMKHQDVVRSTFLVRNKGILRSKNGKSYLALTLCDCTGSIDTRVWSDDAEQLAETFQEGDVIAVSGRAHLFQNRLQLTVDNLAPVEQPVIAEDYLPRSRHDSQKLYGELIGRFEMVQCPWIRQLGLGLLQHPDVSARYPIAPAAKSIHHAYLGGLLVHSLQLVRIVDAIHAFYPKLNKDLLVFGAAFHDFGKIFEISANGTFQYTDEGKLVGHLAIGTILVDRMVREIPGFPVELEWQVKHLILAHHGKIEHGSPVKPQTLEAQLVHELDDMDSKLNSIQELIDSEKGAARWTAVHKTYGTSYFRGTWDSQTSRESFQP